MISATPDGVKPQADSKILRGENLGIWKPILQARKDAVAAYAQWNKVYGNYLSVRWPGDAYSFALAFAEMLG